MLTSTGTPLNTDPTIAASSQDVYGTFPAVWSPSLPINKSRDGIHAHRQAFSTVQSQAVMTLVSMKCSTKQFVAVTDTEKILVVSQQIYKPVSRCFS